MIATKPDHLAHRAREFIPGRVVIIDIPLLEFLLEVEAKSKAKGKLMQDVLTEGIREYAGDSLGGILGLPFS